MIEQGSKVYVQDWATSVFQVSMLLPENRVAVASWPLSEPGVQGEESRVNVWPALPDWHGKETPRGPVRMASPDAGYPDGLVVLVEVGDELHVGRMRASDLERDRPEWEAGTWTRDWKTAVARLREKSGWDAASIAARAEVEPTPIPTLPSEGGPRRVFYVDETMGTPHGFRPIIVTEGERGFSHQGSEAAGIEPWYLSRDFETAKRQVDDWNAELGISKTVAMEIIAASFASDD